MYKSQRRGICETGGSLGSVSNLAERKFEKPNYRYAKAASLTGGSLRLKGGEVADGGVFALP